MFTGIISATRTAGVAALLVAAAVGLAGVARADGQMYGDPGAAAPYWRYQHQQDCGLMSVADVVGQLTGREPSQIGMELRGIFTKSESHRGDVYHFDGTSPKTWSCCCRNTASSPTSRPVTAWGHWSRTWPAATRSSRRSTPKPSGTPPGAMATGPRRTTPSLSPASTPAPTSST